MSFSSKNSGKSAVVTGAGGGLGRDIALGLADKGYIVFGTAFSATEVQDLKEASGGRVSLTVCDITKDQVVRAWAAEVSDALGGGLDLLINNAGILTPGPLEVLPLDAVRHEFEVNVFGALSVVNAFLPALRKGRGRVVQISTWTASLPLPFNGPSGASKAAMEVFATVYRAELKRFGIDVVVAAAGNMRTGGPAKTAAALAHGRADDGARARSLRTSVRHVRCEAQQYAERWARLSRGRGACDRVGGAEPRAEPCAGGSGRRRDAPGRSREIRRRARCVAPPARRPELGPPDNQLFHQRSQP
jgi:NAD(P)-dependent dehydrogenase (short-subunit alcohol dehydrogenase family)